MGPSFVRWVITGMGPLRASLKVLMCIRVRLVLTDRHDCATLSSLIHLSEVLHNLVEAIIGLCRYPYLGDQLILRETQPVCIIVFLIIAS